MAHLFAKVSERRFSHFWGIWGAHAWSKLSMTHRPLQMIQIIFFLTFFSKKISRKQKSLKKRAFDGCEEKYANMAAGEVAELFLAGQSAAGEKLNSGIEILLEDNPGLVGTVVLDSFSRPKLRQKRKHFVMDEFG